MHMRVLARYAVLAAALVAVAGGCGVESAPPAAAPSTPSTGLTVVINDGAGQETTWRLTCDPGGGDHPDAEAACRILQAHARLALPPVRQDAVCTEIYGGPQKATVSGTWRGEPVTASFSRTDGCEMARWDLLEGLLPAASS